MDIPVVSLTSASNGRVSGKSWKEQKSATVYVVSFSSKQQPLTFTQADTSSRRRENKELGDSDGSD